MILWSRKVGGSYVGILHSAPWIMFDVEQSGSGYRVGLRKGYVYYAWVDDFDTVAQAQHVVDRAMARL